MNLRYITNLASIAQILWDILTLYGINPRPIFKEAGLDPARMKKSGARFRLDRLERAWAMADEAIGDPCFGLKAAQVWSPAYFGALGYAIMSSDNLKEALWRMERYHKVIIGWQFIEISETADEFRIKLNPGPSAAAVPQRMDAGMAVILEICRRALRRDLEPLKVTLCHPEPPCSEKYRQFFGRHVEFQAESYFMSLSIHLMGQQLAGADQELASLNEKIMTPYLKRLKGDPFLKEVQALIVRHLPSGNVTDESVAAMLYMSSRSLQRRLQERGTTFNRLVNQIRFDLAKKYLARKDSSMSEITFMLGFSDLTSFSRAFKTWSGIPPRRYRQERERTGML